MAPATFPQAEYAAPPASTRLVLIRHGQTVPAVKGQTFPLVDGHGDPPLSPRGRWQAERVAGRLAGEVFDAIYASSLVRTQQSAEPLARRMNDCVRIERDLREVYLGVAEGGRFRQMAEENHPAIEALHRYKEWGEIAEAESNLELTERVVGALDAIHRNHPDQAVAVFCHGGVIGAAVGHTLSVNPVRMSDARNGSITEIVRTPDEWVLRSFNDAGHVGSLFHDAEPPA
jgi:probable phosphoglycerate mutase